MEKKIIIGYRAARYFDDHFECYIGEMFDEPTDAEQNMYKNYEDGVYVRYYVRPIFKKEENNGNI